MLVFFVYESGQQWTLVENKMLIMNEILRFCFNTEDSKKTLNQRVTGSSPVSPIQKRGFSERAPLGLSYACPKSEIDLKC